MKKTIILAVILGVVAGIGGRLALKGQAGPTEADTIRPNNAPVEVVAANGTVEGKHPEIALRPQVPGILTAINARENATVTRGQVLAELSNESQKAQVELAKAEVTCARERLKKLENGERTQVITRAKAVQSAKEAAYHLAEDDWQRTQNARGGVSAGEIDKMRTQLTLARAEWDQAKADLAMLLEGTRAEDLAAARSEVVVAEAKLHAAEAELAKTRLLAPTDGKVLEVFAEPGELASMTTPQPVLIMADLSGRRVRAFVEELDVDRVQAGQTANIAADGMPGRTFEGKVAVVLPRMGKRAPQSDAANEMKDLYYREVLIDLDGADELPTNLRVQVRIQGSRSER
jgi:multidrug resistance efflux pump